MNTIISHQHHASDDRDIFGFWIYILTDCILFSCLFATYAVLQHNTYGNLSISDITNLPYVFCETLLLLTSSFTFGMAILALYSSDVAKIRMWLIITFILGLSFVILEVAEFANLYLDGHSWEASAAFTAFFSLVGTHGLHVSIGLLCMLVMILQLNKFGASALMKRRLAYLGIFWAFLDIVWIFVFSIVYLMGVI